MTLRELYKLASQMKIPYYKSYRKAELRNLVLMYALAVNEARRIELEADPKDKILF